MEENKKSPVKYLLVKLAIFLVLAVLIFIFKDQAIANLRNFIGTLMIVYGVEAIVFELIFYRKVFFHQNKNYLGFIEIVLGTTLLIFDMDFQTVCVIWATWSIVRESYEIKEIVTETNSIPLAILSGVETLAVIVLSVMLIINANEEHAVLHSYLLIVELILTPLIPLLNEIIIQSHQKVKNTEEK